MKLTASVLDLDFAEVQKRSTHFIKQYVKNCGASGIVIGLSGGIDSGVIAALSSLAIGGEHVIGLMLPEKETFNQNDIDDAQLVADKYGIKTQTCDITPVLESFYNAIIGFDITDRLCKGNIKARTRMTYLYYFANKNNFVVCGSSDKSETMMGYFTKWGDGASDIAPIMDLYKTQVRKLAEHLGFPAELYTKPSTPSLWPKQLAEEEIGIKYETLDLILFGLERFMTTGDIAEQLNAPLELVEKVKERWLANEHKRRMPLTIKIGYRTVGADFRLPRENY
ncbi:MAG: NAD+ synthase [Candidatus Bathyarchaeota archaeon]|nr:NAD+ synthase [Candidatus Bathyarchaeota archaeon]